MLDQPLRPLKDRVLGPVASRCAGRISPTTISYLGAGTAVLAGALAWNGLPLLATATWLFSRLLDGLDGAVARADGRSDDLGGYIDFLLDTVGYTVVPIGIALAANDTTTWTVVSLLIGSFYVNSVSWLLLSALLEKRGAGADSTAESTSVTMPTGLVEGAETIVAFAIALAFPAAAPTVFVVMSIGVVVGIIQRAMLARRLLI